MAFTSLICLDLGKRYDQEKYLFPLLNEVPICSSSIQCVYCTYAQREIHLQMNCIAPGICYKNYDIRKTKKLYDVCIYAPGRYTFAFLGLDFNDLGQ